MVRVGERRSLEDELQSVAALMRKDPEVQADSVEIDAHEPLVRFVTKGGERKRVRVEFHPEKE